VVDVRVGEPDRHRPDTRGTEPVRDQVRVLTRVDDGALGRGVVDHEVAVLDELTVGDLDDSHDGRSPSPSAGGQ